MTDLKLCYVDNGYAYFTTRDLSEQWGDDWNDAPYEHNAGRPYRYGEHDRKQGRQEWLVARIQFTSSLVTPADWTFSFNSEWSVEEINQGRIPWLMSQRGEKSPIVKIMAGASPDEFRDAINRTAGLAGELEKEYE